MEVQYPIQQTFASFSGWVPKPGSLKVKCFGHYEYVCGRYYARREVFADYYYRSHIKGVERSPHLLFAQAGDSIEEILAFTYEWGPLRPTPPTGDYLRSAFPAVNQPSPENYFVFRVDTWRASRRTFADALQLVATDSAEDMPDLLPYRQPEMGPIKTGSIYPYIDTGTPLEVIERLWMADGRMTKEEVRRVAQRVGLFLREKGGPRYQIVFEAVSLMDAFWYMLFLDLTVRKSMVRICANAKCGQPFRAQRTDQKHCSDTCARRAANLAYYHKTGAQLRRRAAGSARRKT